MGNGGHLGQWIIRSHPGKLSGIAQRISKGKITRTASWARMPNGDIHVIGNQGYGPIPKPVLQRIKEATEPCK